MDKMKFDNRTKLIVAAVIIVLALFLIKSGYTIGKFQISDGDLSMMAENYYVINASGSPILRFEQPNLIVLNNSGQESKLINGKAYYILDINNSRPNVYLDSIPAEISDGQHSLTKTQYFAYEQYTKVVQQTWYKEFYQSTKIQGPVTYVDRNITQTVYIKNGTEYINQTVYVNQTVEVEKKVYVEPDLNSWIQKYMYYILGVSVLALWYFTRGKKK